MRSVFAVLDRCRRRQNPLNIVAGQSSRTCRNGSLPLTNSLRILFSLSTYRRLEDLDSVQSGTGEFSDRGFRLEAGDQPAE